MAIYPDEYPTTVVNSVMELLSLGSVKSKVAPYAGQFFSREQIDKIAKGVTAVPHFLVDLEDMIPVAEDSSGREVTDRLLLVVYACYSDKRSETEQAQASYQLANEARKILVAKEIKEISGVHSNGFIRYLGITKELHEFGLSVHALNLFVDIHYNLDSK